MERLQHAWPWHPRWIVFTLAATLISGSVLTSLSYPFMGKFSFWFLGLSAWGGLFSILYALVYKKIRQKTLLLSERGLKPIDGLIALSKFQAPGAVALSNTEFTIAPIVGPILHIHLPDIKKFELTNHLPGKKFVYKKVLQLTLVDHSSIGIAVQPDKALSMYQCLMKALIK